LVPNLYAPNDWFETQMRDCNHDEIAWKYDGYMQIHTGGNYRFCTNSDDGTIVWIDGTQVVNNDGGHGQKEVCSYRGLTPGKKHVVLWGFNGEGPYYNDMYYSGPDTMDTTRYPISVQAGPSMDGVTTKLAASSVQTLAMEHSDKDETSCSPPTTECLRLGVMDNLCGDCLDLGGGDFKLKNSKGKLNFRGKTSTLKASGGETSAQRLCNLAKYGSQKLQTGRLRKSATTKSSYEGSTLTCLFD